jgi:F-type H+-transporting ATPase subunit b
MAAEPHELHEGTEVPHEGSGGLPQLNPESFPSQLFWLAITFAFLYFVMSRIALPRIGTVIEERRDRIADDLDKAAELKTQAEEAGRAYEKAVADARAKARALADDSRRKVKAETDKMRADAETGLSAKLAQAEKQIAQTKTAAMTNVSAIAAETAQAIVQKLANEQIPLGDAERAVAAVKG